MPAKQRPSRKIAPGVDCRGPHQYRWRYQSQDKTYAGTEETLDAAIEARARIKQRVRQGTAESDARSQRVTVDELLAMKKLHRRQSTDKRIDSDLCRIRVLRRDYPEFCARRACSIRRHDLFELRTVIHENKHGKKQRSKATVNQYMILITSAFNGAITDWGYDRLMYPGGGQLLFRVNNQRERRLMPGEWDALRAGAEIVGNSRGRPVAAVLTILLETAMRCGELLALDWKDVDLVRREVTIHGKTTKNSSSRTVGLSQTAIHAFQSVPRQIRGRVFFQYPNPVETRNATNWLTDDRATSIRKAPNPPESMADLRTHDLRHEALSRLGESPGITLFRFMMISGHKTPKVAQRYVHIDRSETAALQAKIADSYSGAITRGG
jgi:integrase